MFLLGRITWSEVPEMCVEVSPGVVCYGETRCVVSRYCCCGGNNDAFLSFMLHVYTFQGVYVAGVVCLGLHNLHLKKPIH